MILVDTHVVVWLALDPKRLRRIDTKIKGSSYNLVG